MKTMRWLRVSIAVVLAGVLVSGCGPTMRMGAAMQGGHSARLSCTAPASLPGTTVRVMLGDMGMAWMLRAVPAIVPAGRVSLVASNMGRHTHELVVLPLAPGASAGQRVPGANGRVAETGSLGEASASCAAGAGEGIRPGAVGWVTLHLAPGRYELVCNLRHHYADGMHQLLLVR